MVLNWPNVQADHFGEWDHYPPEAVVKIVIGPSPSPGGNESAPLELDLAELAVRLPRFKNLTHLYLWNIAGLPELPKLPDGLKCLDVRGCRELESLPDLPPTLDQLVLDHCAKLQTVRHLPKGLPALEDLSCRACKTMPETTIQNLLDAATRLKRFNASDCPQLECLESWPATLYQIELNGCTGISGLPAWPPNLRRIGLRGAAQISGLECLPQSADYVDLAFTESLRELPPIPEKARTLFLYGSGILIPPASEHGRSKVENVANRTRAYFEDVDLVGTGAVKRCKALVLGNGEAGKTCLALALQPDRDPREAGRLGTTHGVQFWDWDIKAKIGTRVEDVHLHLWDFGGQEIYHNTHRLFMGKGAVFLLVWKPEQDGRQPPKTPEGYQDDWRPLQYWVDFIHLACPHKPRIAIVCSHQREPATELEARWKKAVDPRYHSQIQFFQVDSETRSGEFDKLRKWLRVEVGEVVRTQGSAVPSYWEIAQEMVRDWLKEESTTTQMTAEQFSDELLGAIHRQAGRHPQLEDALLKGVFTLTPDRIRRTLEFLTNSGWIYWDEHLFEGRVIIGQKWALDGIYTVLDRRPRTWIHRHLVESDGRFTVEELGETVWKGCYSPDEQRLLVSFMEQCRLCFQLRRAEDAWLEQDVYVSYEHLSSAKAARLQHEFDSRLDDLNPISESVTVPMYHSGHWQSFLIECGRLYGVSARYAKDGIYLENMDGEGILVLCHFRKGGMGAEIQVQVEGRMAKDRLSTTLAYVLSFAPSSDAAPTSSDSAMGGKLEKEQVFISYTWEPPMKEGHSGIPVGYEEPVEAIEEFFKGTGIRVIRDKTATSFGIDLRKFLTDAPRSPHIIVVHSDKYWKSPYCIFELWTAIDELKKNRKRSLMETVIPIEHINSRITVVESLDEYLKYWEGFGRTPALIGWTPDALKDHARSLLRSFSEDLHRCLNLNIRWSDGRQKALEAIAERLGVQADEMKK